jgi:hypothetical protein
VKFSAVPCVLGVSAVSFSERFLRRDTETAEDTQRKTENTTLLVTAITPQGISGRFAAAPRAFSVYDYSPETP